MDIQQVSSLSNGGIQQNFGSSSSARTGSEQAVVVPGSAPAVKVPADAVQPVAPHSADASQINNAVEKVNKVVQAMGNDLTFVIDQETGIHVVKVVEQSTKKVIQQFPSKQIVAIAQSLDQLQGLLVKQKV